MPKIVMSGIKGSPQGGMERSGMTGRELPLV